MILEPIQGEGGFIVPAPGFVKGLAELCAEHGIVFIADEVQSGMGRAGRWFAIEDEDVVPDLITSAKSLGGGLPISAVTGRADLMDAVHVGGLGGTYGGNPVAAAAALAVIDQIEKEGLLERSRTLGEKVLGRLRRDAGPARGDRRRSGPRDDERDRAGVGSRDEGTARRTERERDREAVSRGGRRDPEGRDLRQRHPTAAAAHDRRDSARGRTRASWTRRSAPAPGSGRIGRLRCYLRPHERRAGPNTDVADRGVRPADRGRRHTATDVARLPAAVARAARVDVRVAVHDRRDVPAGVQPDPFDGRRRADRPGRVPGARGGDAGGWDVPGRVRPAEDPDHRADRVSRVLGPAVRGGRPRRPAARA